MSPAGRAGSLNYAPCSDRYGRQAINWRTYTVGEISAVQFRQMQTTVVIGQAYGSFEIVVTAMAIRPVRRLLKVSARSSHPESERAARVVMRSALRPSIGSAILGSLREVVSGRRDVGVPSNSGRRAPVTPAPRSPRDRTLSLRWPEGAAHPQPNRKRPASSQGVLKRNIGRNARSGKRETGISGLPTEDRDFDRFRNLATERLEG